MHEFWNNSTAREMDFFLNFQLRRKHGKIDIIKVAYQLAYLKPLHYRKITNVINALNSPWKYQIDYQLLRIHVRWSLKYTSVADTIKSYFFLNNYT